MSLPALDHASLRGSLYIHYRSSSIQKFQARLDYGHCKVEGTVYGGLPVDK